MNLQQNKSLSQVGLSESRVGVPLPHIDGCYPLVASLVHGSTRVKGRYG